MVLVLTRHDLKDRMWLNHSEATADNTPVRGSVHLHLAQPLWGSRTAGTLTASGKKHRR